MGQVLLLFIYSKKQWQNKTLEKQKGGKQQQQQKVFVCVCMSVLCVCIYEYIKVFYLCICACKVLYRSYMGPYRYLFSFEEHIFSNRNAHKINFHCPCINKFVVCWIKIYSDILPVGNNFKTTQMYCIFRIWCIIHFLFLLYTNAIESIKSEMLFFVK